MPATLRTRPRRDNLHHVFRQSKNNDLGAQPVKKSLQADFSTALEGMRYSSKKTNIGRVWDGLKLRSAVDPL